MSRIPGANSCRRGAALVVVLSRRPARRARAARRAQATRRSARRSTTSEVDGFVAVNADGSVTIYSGKVDLGQGLRIAIPQMAAEELSLDVAPDHADRRRHRAHARSGRDRRQLRHHARRRADPSGGGDRARGADRDSPPSACSGEPADLVAVDGRSVASDGSAAIGYARAARRRALRAEGRSEGAACAIPRRIASSASRSPRPDIPAKVTGTHTYVHDVKRRPACCTPA